MASIPKLPGIINTRWRDEPRSEVLALACAHASRWLQDMRGQEERFEQWFGQAKVLQGEYKLLTKH